MQISFQNAFLYEIQTDQREISLHFTAFSLAKGEELIVVEGHKPVLILKAKAAKWKTLPKKGALTDGELYGVPGKPLNGLIPYPLTRKGEFELIVSMEDKDYTIFCQELELWLDTKSVPMDA